MRNTFTCDICKEVIHENSWGQNAHALTISIYVSSQNPLGELAGNYQDAKIEYRETCDECRRRVALAVDKTLKEIIRPKRKP